MAERPAVLSKHEWQCAANLSANPLSQKDRGNKTGQFGWVAEMPHSLPSRS